MRTVLLASNSPRRREILERAGFSAVVRVADIDETPLPGERAVAYAMRLAAEKARAVLATRADFGAAAFGVSADTVVWLDAFEPLGKPLDAAHARTMLLSLSGRTHRVTTAAAIFLPSEHAERHVLEVTSLVTFRVLSPHDIDAYVATGESFDKAGGYAIQGHGAQLVHSLQGDYLAVMGLPLFEVLGAVRDLLESASPVGSSSRPVRP